jgi:glyoxylase-like metal-dependent hydrolase (beta-lactamase superfamily II)
MSEQVSVVSTDELVPLLDHDASLFLLDVREPDEFADWVIPGAVNIPLGQLEDRLSEVPPASHVVVVCAAGKRAQAGATILASHGIASRVLDGGMGAWATTYDTVATTFGEATVVQVRRRGKGCLSYIVGAGQRCVVIDPSLQISLYASIARDHGWRIDSVVDTHLHADHISGARELVARTGARLLLSPHDPFAFDFEPLVDGLTIELSDAVHLGVEAVSAPGHTEGSTIYRLGDNAIFTGDTLFLESVGRPDLADQAEPFARSLYRSLHERVLVMADDVTILPAHYGAGVEVHGGVLVAANLGTLRQSLHVLALNEEEFVAWAVRSVKDRPPNYQRIVRINAGQENLDASGADLEAGPNRCAIATA